MHSLLREQKILPKSLSCISLSLFTTKKCTIAKKNSMKNLRLFWEVSLINDFRWYYHSRGAMTWRLSNLLHATAYRMWIWRMPLVAVLNGVASNRLHGSRRHLYCSGHHSTRLGINTYRHRWHHRLRRGWSLQYYFPGIGKITNKKKWHDESD